MNKNQRNTAILAALILAALILSFMWISTFQPLQRPFGHRPVEPPPPGDIELYYAVNTVVTTINVALLAFLLATYADLYRKMKSDFTIGLMVFAVVLLLYALSSNPLVQWVFGFRAFGLGPFAMLPELFTLVALAVLLYLTFRY